jgi:hypothetical protein
LKKTTSAPQQAEAGGIIVAPRIWDFVLLRAMTADTARGLPKERLFFLADIR